MGWRRLSRHIAVGRTSPAPAAAAALTESLSPLLAIARHFARAPRPPAWAAAAQRRCQATEAALAASSPGKTSHKGGTTTSTSPPHLPLSHSSVLDKSHRLDEHVEARYARTSAAKEGSVGTPTVPVQSALDSSTDAFGMRSRQDAFDAVPANSYAYVHAKSDKVKTQTASTPQQGRRTPAKGSSLGSSPSMSAAPTTVVTVEGETVPIAAASGAVRRALQQHRSLSTTDSTTSSPSLPTSSLPSAALQRMEQMARSAAVGAPPPASGKDGNAAAPSTLVERRARRERQRQTRELRERRRLERVQQGSGDTLHPCRLQGGCRQHASHDHGGQCGDPHTASPGSCPYRHFPAHRCVTQLRDGFCALHQVGCCPWTHGDVADGAGEGSPATSRFAYVDTPASEALLSGAAALTPLNASGDGDDSVEVLRGSAEKVGRLLRLCVDAVAAAVEQNTDKVSQSAFLDAASSVSLRWTALREAFRRHNQKGSSSPSSSFEGDGANWDGFLRLETLYRETVSSGGVAVLSVPADLAWCAMQPQTEVEPSAEHHQCGVSEDMLGSLHSASPLATTALDAAPMSNGECEYWSSFFTCEGTVSSSLTASANDPPVKGNVAVDVSSGAAGIDASATRVRLTPCLTAWVLDAAAVHLRAEAASTQDNDNPECSGRAISSPTSADECFQQAALYLLGWRTEELRRFLRGEEHQTSSERRAERETSPSAASQGPLSAISRSERWAPVLFLRDVLMASYIPLHGNGKAEMEDDLARLTDGEDGGPQIDLEASSLPFASTRDSLLSLFLDLTTICDDSQRVDMRALVHRGSIFSLLSATSALPASTQNESGEVAETCGSTSPPSHPRSTPNGAAAFQTTFDSAWAEVHDLLIQLQWGLLCCNGQAPNSSTTALSLFLQPAVLQLATSSSSAFALRYEPALRSYSEWQPWTDQQLFVKAHAAAYDAGSYARHHLPVVRLGMLNSLLNCLLLLSTAQANAVFRLEEPSEVRGLLMRSPLAHVHEGLKSRPSTAAVEAAKWWSTTRQSEHRYRQQHLQPFVSLSLGFLTALQELSRHHLATQHTVMQEYEQRRTAHELADESSHTNLAGRSRTGSGSFTSTSGNRTRKYHSRSADDQQAAQHQRLRELRGVSLLDRLLPYGSPTVCPDAAASLLRQLLEGGHPYKALKLAASIVHASRMLRHADKQPRPVLQPGLRTVHSRVWSKRLLRHVLVKKRVPVLRLVGDVEGEDGAEGGRPGEQTRRAVRPVGLVFVLSARVVEEVARVGLRMGEAGAALVDGAQQDCLRGALVDFTDGRALPVPSLATVEAAIKNCGSAVLLSPEASDARGTSLPSSQRPHLYRRRTTLEEGTSAGSLLRLIGVGTSLSASHHTSTQEEEGRGALHRRIAPSPLLLEILQSHTPSSDTARHTSYLRYLLHDIPRFSTWSVLFALQYQACDERSRYGTARMHSSANAARAMETVYIMTTSALCRTSKGAITPTSSARTPLRECHSSSLLGGSNLTALHRQLAREAEAMSAQVQQWILSDPSSLDGRGRWSGEGEQALAPSHPNSPRVKDVKALLLRGAGAESSAETVGDEKEDAKEGQRLRRAKLQLPVLLHHIWVSSVAHRSALQRCTALWAVCAATLLGTTRAALRRTSSNGKSGTDEGHLALALHHSYVAAGVLMRTHAPQQSALHVDATVKTLLLSPALLSEDVDTASASSAAASSIRSEWPMLLSSAHTPVVYALRDFVRLQLTLLTALLDDPAAFTSPQDSLMRELAESFVKAFTAVHGDLVCGVREHPAWLLVAPLLRHPALAQRWIVETFLYPSASLLTWTVSAVARTDAAGYAVLHTWLLQLTGGPHLCAEMQQALLKEAERRQRSATHRKHQHHHHH